MSDSEYWSDFIDGFEPPSPDLEKKRKPEDEEEQEQKQKRPKGNTKLGLEKKRKPEEQKQPQKQKQKRPKVKKNFGHTTIFRLGHVSKQEKLGIEQDIYADGFVMTYTTKSSFNGPTKLVFHITFSKQGNPVCFFVINYNYSVTDKWLWYKKSDVKKKTTLTLKNGEKINVKDFEKIDIEEDLKRPLTFRTNENRNKKQFAQFEDIRPYNSLDKKRQYRIGYEKAENATNFLKTYKSFIPSVDNMPQILGLLVQKSNKKPKNMTALDAYINNITIKRRILSHDEEFKEKIKAERDLLKKRHYPLES